MVNWLALAGWGGPAPPDGALTLKELVEQVMSPIPSQFNHCKLASQFDIESLTHRRAILDPGKLANLNKQHLALKLEHNDPSILERAMRIMKRLYPDRSVVT